MANNDSFPRTHHEDMVDNKRYGKLIIQYEAGNVTVVRKEEVIQKTPHKVESVRR